MSLTHLAEIFGVAVLSRPGPELGVLRTDSKPVLSCAYCGNEVTGVRCQSCGAPRRRALPGKIDFAYNQFTGEFERDIAAVRSEDLEFRDFLAKWGDSKVATFAGVRRVRDLLPDPSDWGFR